MTIREILQSDIAPFEVEDDVLILLFRYYLHRAPTINSVRSVSNNLANPEEKWTEYLTSLHIGKEQHHIYSSNRITEQQLGYFNLSDDDIVTRNTKGIVCCSYQEEPNINCLLRHLRNSIAHGRVYVRCIGNSSILIFDDYNKVNNQSARIVLTKSDLRQLKSVISRN